MYRLKVKSVTRKVQGYTLRYFANKALQSAQQMSFVILTVIEKFLIVILVLILVSIKMCFKYIFSCKMSSNKNIKILDYNRYFMLKILYLRYICLLKPSFHNNCSSLCRLYYSAMLKNPFWAIFKMRYQFMFIIVF